MARAIGAVAASSASPRGVSLLELSRANCVTTTEVGGLLKRRAVCWDSASPGGSPFNSLGSALISDLSVQPLCSLCLCGYKECAIQQPQRHREHRGCTEKKCQIRSLPFFGDY